MKQFITLFMSLIMVVLFGTAISTALDIPALYAYAGTLAASCAYSFIPQNAGIAQASVLREVFTGEVIKYLTNAFKTNFLQGIADYSKYVSAVGDEAQAIHLVDMDVLPEVLINNTTYPIDVQDIGQNDVLIQLDKYSTKQTKITDDELYALTFDKIKVVKDRHGLAIAIAKIKKAIHALAPGAASDKMPILMTTGEDDGTGRKRLTFKDILRLKTKLDELEVPEEGRRLVLCNEHLNDLLSIDEKFKDQFYNRVDGKVYNQYGFEIYDYVGNPYYNTANKTKLSFGAVPTATDRKASVFFSMSRAAQATGWTKMYYSEAKNDPAHQRNMVNFRHYFIVMPTKEEARGAILSDNA